MNILDENIREDQRGLLRSWGIPIRQIGVDVGRKGLRDSEIIPLLHQFRDTSFFHARLGLLGPQPVPYSLLPHLFGRGER